MWPAANGYVVTRVVTEIGSGLNPHRKQLMALLVDFSVKFIVVEHRDRLMRFASEYIEASLGPRKAESQMQLCVLLSGAADMPLEAGIG